VDEAFVLLNPAVAKAVPAPDTPKVADPVWQQYVGRYAWKLSEMQIQILNREVL